MKVLDIYYLNHYFETQFRVFFDHFRRRRNLHLGAVTSVTTERLNFNAHTLSVRVLKLEKVYVLVAVTTSYQIFSKCTETSLFGFYVESVTTNGLHGTEKNLTLEYMCDPEHEVYYIKADSVFAPSNNTFTVYMNTPLRNVVRAELMSLSAQSNLVSSGGQSYMYMYVNELTTKFNDRANGQTSIQVSGQTSNIGLTQSGVVANKSKLASAIMTVPLEQIELRTNFTVNQNYSAEARFIEPIRQIDRLSIELLNDVGASLNNTGNTFSVFRFTCAKGNRCLY